MPVRCTGCFKMFPANKLVGGLCKRCLKGQSSHQRKADKSQQQINKVMGSGAKSRGEEELSTTKINKSALMNLLCPYCLTSLEERKNAEVCYSCHKQISWVEGALVCKPGEEQEARRIATLLAKNQIAASVNTIGYGLGCLLLIVIVIAIGTLVF